MKATTVRFGNPTGGIRYIFQWAESLWNPANAVDIAIDFSNFIFPKPFELIFIVNQIADYKNAFPYARISYTGYNGVYDISRMGLFQLLDANIQTCDTGAIRSDYYHLPLTRVTLKEFRGVDVHPADTNDAIEMNAGHLAERLTQSSSGYVFDAIQYSLREIIRNIYEHSSASEFIFAAKYFPSSKIAEICISDNGSGIHSSLTRNPKFNHLSQRDSIQWACLPGVSGNPLAFSDDHSGNPWRNSGYGLYMMSRLCRNDGDFLIMSGNLTLYMQSEKNIFPVKYNRGTTVRLHLNLGDTSDLRAKLAAYARDGKATARDIAGAEQVDASTASMMLKRDFDVKVLANGRSQVRTQS